MLGMKAGDPAVVLDAKPDRSAVRVCQADLSDPLVCAA
jgi:hypothetical protein